MSIRKFIRKKYHSFEGYTPGIQPYDDGWIKLNTNENPYAASPQIEKLLQNFNIEDLKKYPSNSGEPLRSAIARKYSLPENRIVVTNGSDESLALIFLALFEEDDFVSTPQLTYSLYPILGKIYSGQMAEVPIDENFQIDLEALDQEKSNKKIKAVILPNPNAPTGQYFYPKDLLKRISLSDRMWIIDEAYADFALEEKSSLLNYSREIMRYRNVIVTRTFSKSYSLAGMRIGYMVVPDENLASLFYQLKDSYNEDLLSLLIGKAALEDEKTFRENVKKIIITRKKVELELSYLGFQVLPSNANFILVKPLNTTAENYYNALLKEKILVRYFNDPLLKNYVRISIGSDEEMEKLLKISKVIHNG